MGASCAVFSVLGLVGNAYRKPLLVLALLFSLFVEAALTALLTLLVLDGRIVDMHVSGTAISCVPPDAYLERSSHDLSPSPAFFFQDLCPEDLSRSTCTQAMTIFTFTSGAMIETVLIILFHTVWSHFKRINNSAPPTPQQRPNRRGSAAAQPMGDFAQYPVLEPNAAPADGWQGYYAVEAGIGLPTDQVEGGVVGSGQQLQQPLLQSRRTPSPSDEP